MEEVRPLSVSAQMDLLALELRLPFCSFILLAGVAELADALDSKSSDRKIVWVRSPPPAALPASIRRSMLDAFFFPLPASTLNQQPSTACLETDMTRQHACVSSVRCCPDG